MDSKMVHRTMTGDLRSETRNKMEFVSLTLVHTLVYRGPLPFIRMIFPVLMGFYLFYHFVLCHV
jgi:hypothetical protein